MAGFTLGLKIRLGWHIPLQSSFQCLEDQQECHWKKEASNFLRIKIEGITCGAECCLLKSGTPDLEYMRHQSEMFNKVTRISWQVAPFSLAYEKSCLASFLPHLEFRLIFQTLFIMNRRGQRQSQHNRGRAKGYNENFGVPVKNRYDGLQSNC